MTRRRVHYVVGTHWDREWHQSFQDFRYALVRLFDRVLAGLERGELAGPFQTDGQTIPVEDYLQVRPDRREQVVRMARAGKLSIGPWYSMPDEFTVSGEALIRNLRVGRERAAGLGAVPSSAGYVPDMFGHTSQLPQIFAGFGMPAAFIWRGINPVAARAFRWRGADGTEILCHRFGPVGYGTFAHQVRRGHERQAPVADATVFGERLAQYLEREAAATAVDSILLLDSCDHLEWDPDEYAHIRVALEQGDAAFELVHTDLDVYAAEMLAQAGQITETLEGELREPGWATPEPGQEYIYADQQWVIPGVLSSRANLKQANGHCQTLLCHWAEPFSAIAAAVTPAAANAAEAPGDFLALAWRTLMENHAHDSIDGCGIDQVHRDMLHRFDQVRLIAERVTKEATCALAASVAGALPDDELRVTVFNPLPRPFDGVAELNLQIPAEWPRFNEFFGFEPKPGFRIYGPDGRELPYQRLGQAMGQVKVRTRPNKFPDGYHTNDVAVALPLSVPALGYTTLALRAAPPGHLTRHPETPGLATAENAMANEFLSVVIGPNGALTLTDRRTGHVYARLLTFEDRADIGDGWYHGIAVNDQVFTSTAAATDIALVHDGPYLTTFRVRTVMRVPAEFRFDRMVRSGELAELVVDSLISLRPGQDYLDVHTTVENTADDHRLRVLLPSGAAAATTYLADAAFDVVERPIALRADNHLYRELEVETKPQQGWTAVFAGDRGLAVVADALLETAVRDLPERPLALTLFRGTRRTVFTGGEPDGQLRGRLDFAYRIVPLAGAPDRTRLCELGQGLSAGLRAVQLRGEDLSIYGPAQGAAALPRAAAFLQLTGRAVLTSAQQVGDGFEVRLFNPWPEPIAAGLDVSGWPGGPATAQRVNFESRPAGEPFPVGQDLTLGPKEIVTLRLV